MNRILYEHFLQVMTANGGYFGFDTWGLPENAEIYRLLTGKKLVEIEGKVYTITEVKEGGAGMGAYPARVNIRQITDMVPYHIPIE